MKDEKAQIPEVAGETPQDPNIVGTMNQEEMQALFTLRQQSSQITMDIGSLEIRKAKLISDMARVEHNGQELLQSVGARLGLTDKPWQVLPDGRIRLVVTEQAPTEEQAAE